MPCVSPVDEEDNDNEGDSDNNNGDKEDDNDNYGDKEDTDDDEEEDIFNFDLNDVDGMSEYGLMYLQRVHRNNARLVSLSLLAPMPSAASPPRPTAPIERNVWHLKMFL